MATAWIIIGTNGEFVTSSIMPPQIRSTFQRQAIESVLFAPDTNSYFIITSGGEVTWTQNFPNDLAQATQALVQAGNTPLYLSWLSDGCWSVFCRNGAYALGPNVPSDVENTIQNYMQLDAAGQARYAPANLIFSPLGDWLLVGYDEADEGSGTYDYSANFPAEVIAAANNLPVHVGVATVTFDPSGFLWVLVDTYSNITMNAAPGFADLATALGNWWGGVQMVQFALVGLYTMPVWLYFNLEGPIITPEWSQSLQGQGQAESASLESTIQIEQSSAAGLPLTTQTEGESSAAQPVLTVSSTAGFLAGQTVVINPGGGTQEEATIASVDINVSLTMQANLAFDHAPGETVVNTLLNWALLQYVVSVPASLVQVPVTCTFTDDSASVSYDGVGGVDEGGNHGHWEVKIQQLMLDPLGNPLASPDGSFPWWNDVPGASAVVDLYGPGAATEPPIPGGPAGTPIPGAAPNQSVSTTVMLPVNLTSARTLLRCAFRYYLGDTRNPNSGNWGPLQTVALLGSPAGSGGGSVVTEFPSVNDYGSWFTNWFQMVVQVLPSDFVQLKLLPVALIYCPPGDKSSESFAFSTTLTNIWSFSDTYDTAYMNSNDQQTKLQFNKSSDVLLGGSYQGFKLSIDLSNTSQTTETWDTTTSTTLDTSVQNSQTIKITNVSTQTYGPAVMDNAAPGDTAPWWLQPFWSDVFLLMIHPQFRVWNYPGLYAITFMSSWPLFEPVTVAQLSTAANVSYATTVSIIPPTQPLLYVNTTNRSASVRLS